MSAHPKTKHRLHRRLGVSSLELIVAFTLLGSVLAMATPLVVAHGRLLKAQRNYRLALDELSNQIEVLGTLPPGELPAAIGKLTPSPQTDERLPGATLRGSLAESKFGQQVTLEIWWDEPGRQDAPVRLTGWLVSRATSSTPNEE